MDWKPSVYSVSPSSLNQSNIQIDSSSAFYSINLTSSDWTATNYSNQSHSPSAVFQENNSIETQFNTVGDIQTINSPILSSTYGAVNSISTVVSAQNASNVDLHVVQYSGSMNIVSNISGFINYGTFTQTQSKFSFESDPMAEYFMLQITYGLETNQTLQSSVWLNDVNVTSTVFTLKMANLNDFWGNSGNSSPIENVQTINPTKIVVSVNSTAPFILATADTLDNSWVATVNGWQIKPTTLYLGLQGFLINKTGRFDVTIQYQPQTWFYYGSIISISTLLIVFALYLYIVGGKTKSISNPSNKHALSILMSKRVPKKLVSIYKNQFSFMELKLNRELKDCSSFIELGCGAKSPAINLICHKRTVGIDRYLPSLKENKNNHYFEDYIVAI